MNKTYIQYKDGTLGCVQQKGAVSVPAGAKKLTQKQYESEQNKIVTANAIASDKLAADANKKRAAAIAAYPELEGLI